MSKLRCIECQQLTTASSQPCFRCRVKPYEDVSNTPEHQEIMKALNTIIGMLNKGSSPITIAQEG